MLWQGQDPGKESFAAMTSAQALQAGRPKKSVGLIFNRV